MAYLKEKLQIRLGGKLHNSRGMLGKHHSEETKRKIKESNKKWNNGKRRSGWHHTDEAKKRIGDGHRGLNNVNWNPDREAMRKNKRNDPEYQQWIKKVKKRDKNICRLKDENCSGYNIVHHIKGWTEYPELRYNINNGITLCRAHHPRTRAKEKRLEEKFQNLILISSKLI